MQLPARPHSILDDANAAFLLRRVSVIVASRDAANVPSAVRAIGCKLLDGGERVGAFVPRASGAGVLCDVAASGRIALVATRPSTFRTIQLKGTDARIEPLAAGDDETVRAYVESFVEDTAPLGYRERTVRAVLAVDVGDLVVVAFTPAEAFVQTPGPGAGRRLVADR